MATTVPLAYINSGYGAIPEWLNKGDNAWQLTAATLVGIQSMPGLVVLYGSIVKKKWAVNSAFMALYAFASTWLCWVLWAYDMAFGEHLVPIWGKAGSALGYKFLLSRATLPSTAHFHKNGTLETPVMETYFGMADMVLFQFFFAALTLIMLAGSVLGRMSFRAWMLFCPLWLTFSYTVGAFSMWGGGFLSQWGVLDYAGGYVIHVSSGVAGFVAAYWVSHQGCHSLHLSSNWNPSLVGKAKSHWDHRYSRIFQIRGRGTAFLLIGYNAAVITTFTGRLYLVPGLQFPVHTENLCQ